MNECIVILKHVHCTWTDRNNTLTLLVTILMVWYYACHGTKCKEYNSMAPSLTSIDVTLLQTQGNSAIPDTKVFYNSDCIQFSSCHRSTRERELVRVYKQAHLPLHSDSLSVVTPKDSVDLNSVLTLTQLNQQLTNFSKFFNFYIFWTLSISLVWCHLTKSLHHIITIITRVPRFHYTFI